MTPAARLLDQPELARRSDVRRPSDWPVREEPLGTEGLVSVLIARRHRHDKASVCGYLADVCCLGVKNALGPMIVDELALPGFAREYFDSYDGGPLDAPIELARQLVFGSLEYARGLGFDPHPDFTAAEGHLGPWTPPSTITFGKGDKPLYISGPTTIRSRSPGPSNAPPERETSSSWRPSDRPVA